MLRLGSVWKLHRRVRDRAVFRLAKPVPSDAEGTEAGDIACIVDAAGCSQAENKPLEARSSFQTEPNTICPVDLLTFHGNPAILPPYGRLVKIDY